MKISFNPLYNFSHSLDIVVGELSIAKILYKSEGQTYSVYSEFTKEYVATEIASQDEAKLIVKYYFRDLFNKIDAGAIQTKTAGCDEVGELLKAEVPIIQKHLSRHKWFQHINDDNEAMIDFIKNYGFILKEFYCVYVCKKRDECQHAKDLVNGAIEETPEELE